MDARNTKKYDLERFVKELPEEVFHKLSRAAVNNFKLRQKTSFEEHQVQLKNKKASYAEQFLIARPKLIRVVSRVFPNIPLDEVALSYVLSSEEEKLGYDIAEVAFDIGISPVELATGYKNAKADLMKFHEILQPEQSIKDLALCFFEKKPIIDLFTDDICVDLSQIKSNALNLFVSTIKTSDASIPKILKLAIDSYQPSKAISKRDALMDIEDRALSFVSDYRAALSRMNADQKFVEGLHSKELVSGGCEIKPEEIVLAGLETRVAREAYEKKQGVQSVGNHFVMTYDQNNPSTIM